MKITFNIPQNVLYKVTGDTILLQHIFCKRIYFSKNTNVIFINEIDTLTFPRNFTFADFHSIQTFEESLQLEEFLKESN